MRVRRVIFWGWVFIAAAATPVGADTIGINVLEASYTTDLMMRIRTTDGTFVTTTGTTVSDAPVGDTLQSSRRVYATATADIFSVETRTGALYDGITEFSGTYTDSSAETALLFAPEQDGVALLGLNFQRTFAFAGGFVSLLDATTGQLLWSYSDFGFIVGSEYLNLGNVPWVGGGDVGGATISVSQQLFSSHAYQLLMHTQSNARTDSGNMILGVTGLHVVPEPSTVLLLGLGLSGVWWHRRQPLSTYPVRCVAETARRAASHSCTMAKPCEART